MSTTPRTTAPTDTMTRPICSGKIAGRLGAIDRRRRRFHIGPRLPPPPAIVDAVEDAFGTVLFVVVALGVIVAAATLVTSGKAYDQIGKGGLSLRDGSDRPAVEPTDAASIAIRDDEIRQMLLARNERRVRRGQEPVDVDAELAALTRTRVDPALLAEVRELVESRNRRRLRQGKPPLDVDAEVARQLEEFA